MAKVAKSEELHREERRAAMMPLERPSFPLNLVERMDDIFGERWSPWLAIRRVEDLLRSPPIDVYEEGDQVVVKAELPGLKRQEINVEASGRAITISGKKEKEEKVDKKDYSRFERSSGAFSRSVPLPAEIQLESATAQLKDGVLEIRAPKLLRNREARRNVEVT